MNCYSNPRLFRGEIYNRGTAVLEASIPSAYRLACGAPLGFSTGAFHGMRISSDANNQWTYLTKAADIVPGDPYCFNFTLPENGKWFLTDFEVMGSIPIQITTEPLDSHWVRITVSKQPEDFGNAKTTVTWQARFTTVNDVKVLVEMPSHFFVPGDPCHCNVRVFNATGNTFDDKPLFVILDVYSTLFSPRLFHRTISISGKFLPARPSLMLYLILSGPKRMDLPVISTGLQP